ncbi:acetylglutamate kinase [Alishewanella longhuensis]
MLLIMFVGFSTEKIDGQRFSTSSEQTPVITGALDGAVNAEMVEPRHVTGLKAGGLKPLCW